MLFNFIRVSKASVQCRNRRVAGILNGKVTFGGVTHHALTHRRHQAMPKISGPLTDLRKDVRCAMRYASF
jgi:hypothetical protein